MYGYPSKGILPNFQISKKRGRPSDLSKYLQKQTDAFPVELAVETVKHSRATPDCTRACLHPMACNNSCGGNFSAAVAAMISRIQCEGCE